MSCSLTLQTFDSSKKIAFCSSGTRFCLRVGPSGGFRMLPLSKARRWAALLRLKCCRCRSSSSRARSSELVYSPTQGNCCSRAPGWTFGRTMIMARITLGSRKLSNESLLSLTSPNAGCKRAGMLSYRKIRRRRRQSRRSQFRRRLIRLTVG
jgi:hypothetical protein